MEPEDIRATIVLRLLSADDSCNSFHLNCIEAQLRALVYCLNGDTPPVFNGDWRKVCEAAEIPYIQNDDGTFEWYEWWLTEHGFIVSEDDIEHPVLNGVW